MNGNKLMQQVTSIFSIFMVLFYMGVGIFFIFFSDRSYLDKPVRVIMGVTFLLYGTYRAFRTYTKIVEAFFTKDDENE